MNVVKKLAVRGKAVVKSAVKARLLRGTFSSRTFRFTTGPGKPLPVLMCLWNRPGRITDVLRQLDAQDFPAGVELYLWNNNRRDHWAYLAALASFTGTGALRNASIVKSPFNLGSIARFYWARKLVLGGRVGPVIVIDDDENFGTDFISTCARTYEPTVVSGWWAFAVGESYYDRSPASVGGRVDHVGPGGMVCTIELFRDRRFFESVPERFWLLDDIWFSYFAKKSGLTLAKLPVDIEFVLAETNQHHGQADVKREFFDHLYAT